MAPVLFTIGFTQSSAASFFERLQAAGVRRVLDVRLKNGSQLAGFAKRDDLAYLLQRLGGVGYTHALRLAPTETLLPTLRGRRDWDSVAKRFSALMERRHVERDFTLAQLDRACLLCAEPTAERCHRRLVAEHLQRHHPSLVVAHL